MGEDEDWLFRPVLRGLCPYTALVDGTLGLDDIALMNEALDVEAENMHRFEKSRQQK